MGTRPAVKFDDLTDRDGEVITVEGLLGNDAFKIELTKATADALHMALVKREPAELRKLLATPTTKTSKPTRRTSKPTGASVPQVPAKVVNAWLREQGRDITRGNVSNEARLGYIEAHPNWQQEDWAA